jgi:hypothetical protein
MWKKNKVTEKNIWKKKEKVWEKADWKKERSVSCVDPKKNDKMDRKLWIDEKGMKEQKKHMEIDRESKKEGIGRDR